MGNSPTHLYWGTNGEFPHPPPHGILLLLRLVSYSPLEQLQGLATLPLCHQSLPIEAVHSSQLPCQLSALTGAERQDLLEVDDDRVVVLESFVESCSLAKQLWIAGIKRYGSV